MSATIAERPATVAPSGAPKSRFRRDVQALRAIAVLVVILDHLAHWPSGGFVGVDIFFVISGFLITSLLLKEHDRTGRTSFVGFYRRRIKRIVPAATTVLVVTVAASYMVFLGGRGDAVLTDAVWAFFFSANWHFAAAGTDYFQATGPTSPLQHYWSLSVEEQFYFVWPWVMLLLFKLTRGNGRRAVGVAMAFIVAASFLWAMRQSVSDSTIAYFSTFTRVWELGIGALLAIYAPQLQHIPGRVRPGLAWGGLAGIVAALFLITDTSTFPAPWAALPVLATALVIASGTGPEEPHLGPLTSRPVVYVGDISYSLYLWHFPVIILLAGLIDPSSVLYYSAAVALIVLCSVASYHLIEDPIRTSEWLEPRAARGSMGPFYSQQQKIGALGLAAAVTAALMVAALTPKSPPASSVEVALTPQVQSTSEPVDVAKVNASIRAQLRAGLRSDWPATDLSMNHLLTLKAQEFAGDPCFNDYTATDHVCTHGTGTEAHTAALLGDSIALAWAPTVETALPDWGVSIYAKYACPAAGTLIRYQDGPRYDQCVKFHGWAVRQIVRTKPDVVFISNADREYGELSDGATGAAADAEWSAAWRSTVRTITEAGSKVVFLRANPVQTSIAECATRFNKPGDCAGSPDEFSAATARVEAAVVANVPDAVYVDTLGWFCVDGRCPQVVDGQPSIADGEHMTEWYSRAIAPALLGVLQQKFPRLLGAGA